eukprot:6180880-Ditylum_brightwellii.AAC.1
MNDIQENDGMGMHHMTQKKHRVHRAIKSLLQAQKEEAPECEGAGLKPIGGTKKLAILDKYIKSSPRAAKKKKNGTFAEDAM